MAARPDLIFIVGPTGSGKSDLAMCVAAAHNGEIIAADSQTIRRGLDIVTAKPTPEDRQRITHHLLDIIDAKESFSVAEFKERASRCIAELKQRHKLPVIVGGSGLYIDALFYDYSLPNRSDDKARQALEDLSVEALQDIITARGYKMPQNKQNPRHLVGTILRDGKNATDKTPLKGAYIVGLLPADDVLKAKLRHRIERMFANGLTSEASRLQSRQGFDLNKLDAIGYDILNEFLLGEINESDAIEKLFRAHWQYVRRQKAWFKRNKYIHWYTDIDTALTDINLVFAAK